MTFKSFIIFGGTGFIGSALTEYIANININNKITVVGSLKNKLFNPIDFRSNIEYISINVFDYTDFSKLINHDVCINLISSDNFQLNNSFLNINLYEEDLYINYLLKILNVCSLKGVKFIHTSSGGTVYGEGFNKPINENYTLNPISPYGIRKKSHEDNIVNFSKTLPIDYNIIRISNVYGIGQLPYKGQGIIAIILSNCLKNNFNVIKYGNNNLLIRDYIYISDVVSGIYSVINYGENNSIYNLGTGIGLSFNQLVRKIEIIFNHKININYEKKRLDVNYNVLDIKKISLLNSWSHFVGIDVGLEITKNWLINVK